MRLVLIDPNLEHTFGHHPLYARAILNEAGRRGIETVLVANKVFPEPTFHGLEPLRVLETTCYGRFSHHPLFGSFDDVEEGNARVFAELNTLTSLVEPGDLIVLHTVSHTSLLGTVSWLATLPAEARPAIAIFLMLPPGISLDPASVEDPAAALGYRAAMQVVKDADLDIAFFGSGVHHARLFSEFVEGALPSHALLTCFDENPIPDKVPGRVLLFAGDAKISKGIHLVPDVVRTVVPKYPHLDFVVQTSSTHAWGTALDAVNALAALKGTYDNLTVMLESISTQSYADMVGSAEVTLLPYDPVAYRDKSSGVLWETVASGGLAVVSEGSWLAAEARAWGLPIEIFAPHTAKAAVEALERAFDRRGEPATGAAGREAMQAFAAANGRKMLMDQLADVWVGRKARQLTIKPPRFEIDAAHISGEGWHGPEMVGAINVRWSMKTADIVIKLSEPGTWALVLSGIGMIGGEQVEKAMLSIDGTPLAVSASFGEGSHWQLNARFEETERVPERRTLTMTLPWDYNPPNDPRALGVLVTGLAGEKTTSAIEAGMSVPEPLGDAATLSPSGWTAPLRHGSWVVRIDPNEDHVLTFNVHGSATSGLVRSVRVFMGARELSTSVVLGHTHTVRVPIPKALFVLDPTPTFDIVASEPVALRMRHARPASEALSLEDSPLSETTVEIIFDERFEGTAFHDMERFGDEAPQFRWMGRGTHEEIPLPALFAVADSVLVEVHIQHIINTDILDGFTLAFNNRKADGYDLSDGRDCKIIKSAIFKGAKGETEAFLSLHADRWADLSAQGDPRHLVVAISKIVVTATEGGR